MRWLGDWHFLRMKCREKGGKFLIEGWFKRMELVSWNLKTHSGWGYPNVLPSQHPGDSCYLSIRLVCSGSENHEKTIRITQSSKFGNHRSK